MGMRTSRNAGAARPLLVQPDEPFQLSLSPDPVRPVLRVRGELESRSAAFFDRAIDEAMDREPECIVVDLTDMTFADSSGLRSLVRARARVGSREALVLRGPQRSMLRLLELSGLRDEFTVE
jgi:anti-sigma B factor antagonist